MMSTDRPIMAVTVNWPFTITTLLTGTYWIEWGMAGNPSLTGPWVPAVSFATDNNVRQLNLTNGEPGTWAPRGDYAEINSIAEFPFVICGSEVPAPQITSLSPDQAVAGGAEFTLTVNGSGFIDGTGSDRSVVHWNGSPRATTFVSSTQLTATIPASDVATAGTANVTVFNPAPGGGTSNTATSPSRIHRRRSRLSVHRQRSPGAAGSPSSSPARTSSPTRWCAGTETTSPQGSSPAQC